MTYITPQQADELQQLVADMVEAIGYMDKTGIALDEYAAIWKGRAEHLTKQINQQDNFIWTRSITLTPDEIRVLREVNKKYGTEYRHYYGDGAIAARIGRQYDLITFWDNPYRHCYHFGISHYGKELFDDKNFQQCIKALDEKQAQAAVESEEANAN